MIAALLREQYEQEKATEQLVFEQELKTQRQFFITTILLIGLGLLGLIIFIQMRNNRKLKSLNQTLDLTNKKLEQSNFELKTFNYIASHDIKEPIRNIGSYAGLIFRKLSSDQKESLGSYFETIKNSTKQLYTLIEDFAKYTNLSKDTVIKKQDVDLKWLVGSVKDGIHDTIQKYEGRVITQELPTIHSNSSLLYPILKNLIENGLKFNRSIVPTVTISYQQSTDYHQIIVTDNGIGIEENYHEKIFEMFKRLYHRGQYDGSGVGLAIVKLCLDKLDGTIDLESKENEGTTFTIQLPVQ